MPTFDFIVSPCQDAFVCVFGIASKGLFFSFFLVYVCAGGLAGAFHGAFGSSMGPSLGAFGSSMVFLVVLLAVPFLLVFSRGEAPLQMARMIN